MNIMINFSTLKKGGGQNVAMNFLYEIFNIDLEDTLYFFVANGSDPHIYLEQNGLNNYYVVPSNPVKRVLFELFLSKRILEKNKIDIIYSYFGIGLFPKHILQISGSADSNLYFPEIDFWSHYKGIARFKKKLIDIYRIYGLKRVNAVVFENKIMLERSKELYNLKDTKFIKPSVNFNFEGKTLEIFQDYKHVKKGLFLCGWQLNKNVMIIPKIASELKERNEKFLFIITAPEDNSIEHQNFLNLIDKYDVKEYILIIGPISKTYLKSLYEQIDYVFLLSKLESFSNNIIESWYFKKLLIVSDELWSRSLCNNAAMYVSRDNVKDIVDKIVFVNRNDTIKNEIITFGNNELKTYPTIKERIIQEMEYIKHVYEIY